MLEKVGRKVGRLVVGINLVVSEAMLEVVLV